MSPTKVPVDRVSPSKPFIAITMGDPAGVGPELCLRIVFDAAVRSHCVPIVFGDACVLRSVGSRLNLPVPNVLRSLDELDATAESAVLDLGIDPPVEPGVISASTGRAAYEYIHAALEETWHGRTAALVTGPIHKEAFAMADVPYPGHTELLMEKTGSARVCMMLTSDEISCSVATAHIGFHEILACLTTQAILDAIELSHEAIQRIRDRQRVQLTVCGLNPHAGEHGLFGNDEEAQVILPAILAARERGISVTGPLPPDSAFTPHWRAQTDCYICMYHDQGLIPLKALAFDTAVNVTLGLPVVRTSVDHGTALDIAWQGKASSSSFQRAVLLATKLAGSR